MATVVNDVKRTMMKINYISADEINCPDGRCRRPARSL